MNSYVVFRNIDTSGDACVSPGFVIPDLIGDPEFVDACSHGNEPSAGVVEFVRTLENRYKLASQCPNDPLNQLAQESLEDPKWETAGMTCENDPTGLYGSPYKPGMRIMTAPRKNTGSSEP